MMGGMPGDDVPEMRGLRRLALMVEYEGTRYHGFQYQKNAPSVQEELEAALYRFTGEWRRIKAAGRTDAGVHATGQVVAFDTWSWHPTKVVIQALNHYLPEDISVQDAREVGLDFDPRRWAVSREYSYRIMSNRAPSPLLRRFVHTVRKSLDLGAIQEATRLVEGERDFAPFSGPLEGGKSTRRVVYRCSLTARRELVELNMVASGFLPQQVRRTVGALLEVGLGRLSLEEFSLLAECGILGAARWVAPARGLVLTKVNYPQAIFPQENGELEENLALEVGGVL
ncbi:MAG: tRNA pseudouridine(38-40) synthase TruA [Chloroflexi bacterium]|nr:tRNA pseudouridine(38-40) synthase TruA [Chloroflexota bacterium]